MVSGISSVESVLLFIVKLQSKYTFNDADFMIKF